MHHKPPTWHFAAFTVQLATLSTPRFVYTWCTCGASSLAMHQALALFVCESDYAMQVPVVGIDSTQDAFCGSQDHCNSMMLSKKSYIDNQENAHPWRQHPQSDRSNLMPDWYWLGPYESMDAKVECHVKPQTIDCLNHLRKQRTAM